MKPEIVFPVRTELMHTFRSVVVNMTKTEDDRIIVLLASGKAYISNKKVTRWYPVKL